MTRILNLKQKVIIWVGLALVAQIGLYPPWIQEYSDGEYRLGPTASIHYWIFSPPGPPPWVWGGGWNEKVKTPALWSSHLDVARLLAEWATVILVMGGFAWTLRDPRKPGEANAGSTRI
jgi:hypothetical protein